MSEYQYYEFAAINRPLTRAEMAQLRGVSSRAEITASGFVNHYEWRGLKADPADWMRRYFDAFVYTADWWLAAIGELGEDACEPEVPPGLANLSPAQQALVEFIEVDPDMLAAAAAGSARALAEDGDKEDEEGQSARIDTWLGTWAREEMAATLKLIAQGQGREAERQIRSRFATWLKTQRPSSASAVPRRNVGQLRELARPATGVRRQREAEERAAQEAERRRQRETVLRLLMADVHKRWSAVDAQAQRGSASGYDQAVRALTDLAVARLPPSERP